MDVTIDRVNAQLDSQQTPAAGADPAQPPARHEQAGESDHAQLSFPTRIERLSARLATY